MVKRLVALALLSLMLLTPVIAGGDKGPKWNAATDTIEADGIVVRFMDRTPQYMVWIPGANETAVYFVKFVKIVEFEDKDGDNYPDEAEILATAPLTARDLWTVNAYTLEHDNVTELVVAFKANVSVIPTGTEHAIAPPAPTTEEIVHVEFINRIFSGNYSIDGYEIAGGKELKIDIIISDWPWHSNTSKLSLNIVLAGMFHGKEGVPKCEHKQIRVREKNIRQITMQGEDAYQMAFRWEERVQIREGTNVIEAGVNDSFEETRDCALIHLVYPHFNGTLEHDPSIVAFGTEEGAGALPVIGELAENKVALAGLVAVIVVIAAVVVLVRRK